MSRCSDGHKLIKGEEYTEIIEDYFCKIHAIEFNMMLEYTHALLQVVVGIYFGLINMRMWMVNPELMCNKHLLGEHFELHMAVGCINKGISINGYIRKKLIEVHSIRQRHDDISVEMTKRGMIHLSTLPYFQSYKLGNINVKKNTKELSDRCKDCSIRMKKEKFKERSQNG